MIEIIQQRNQGCTGARIRRTEGVGARRGPGAPGCRRPLLTLSSCSIFSPRLVAMDSSVSPLRIVYGLLRSTSHAGGPNESGLELASRLTFDSYSSLHCGPAGRACRGGPRLRGPARGLMRSWCAMLSMFDEPTCIIRGEDAHGKTVNLRQDSVSRRAHGPDGCRRPLAV